MKMMNKKLCLLLSVLLVLVWLGPVQALAAEETLQPTEPEVTEEAAAPEETLPTETAGLTQPTETAEETQSPEGTCPILPEEEDEWMFTLEEGPEETDSFVAENRWQLLLAALVLGLFGGVSCFLGAKLGGLKFLLWFRGIKTTGTLTGAEWDAWHRGYRLTVTYPLENGRSITSEWPVIQSGLNLERNLGKTYRVCYDPADPTTFDCLGIGKGKALGLLAVLIGLLLIAGAAALVGMVL